MNFFFSPSLSCGCRRQQGTEGCWNLCSHPEKAYAALNFWQFYPPTDTSGTREVLRGLMDGNQSSEQPQAQIQKLLVRLCCCRALHHPNTTWLCAMGMCPVRSPRMAPASPFQSAPPVLAEFCPEKHHGSDVPWAALTLWTAQFSQNLPASSSQQRQGDPGRCPQLWFGWWCLLHALHTDNLDKIPLISWFSLE